MPYKYVSFSSGALGGLSLIGCWRALEDQDLVRNIKGVSGCSIGSIIATLASIGYTSKEMEIIAKNVKYEDYADQSLLLISEHYGIETGRKLVKLLDRLIRLKTGFKGLTFKEHWRLTGRQLWINATHVEQKKCVYYSVTLTPDMKIVDAIRRSIAIPFLFTAVRTEEGTFVDGGCYEPLPVGMFPKEETLCLNVRNGDIAQTNTADTSLIKFSASLLNGMLTELNVLRFEKLEAEGYQMVYIRTEIGSFLIDVDPERIDNLIRIGYDALKGEINAT
jgi:predicted acylesterase/phospholipase RssA